MSKAGRGTPSERTRALQSEKPKVFDTYLKALERLSAIAPHVEELEEEVAEREVAVLTKVLALMEPVVARIARPIVLNEPWLADGDASRVGHPLREEGVILVRSFKQER